MAKEGRAIILGSDPEEINVRNASDVILLGKSAVRKRGTMTEIKAMANVAKTKKDIERD